MPMAATTMLSRSFRRVVHQCPRGGDFRLKRFKSSCEASPVFLTELTTKNGTRFGLSSEISDERHAQYNRIEERAVDSYQEDKTYDTAHLFRINENCHQGVSVRETVSKETSVTTTAVAAPLPPPMLSIPLTELLGYAEDAQEMLDHALQQNQQQETPPSEFLSKLHLTALSAWVQCAKNHSNAHSKEHAEKAHELLMQWHNYSPEMVPWIAHERVLHAWFRLKSRNSRVASEQSRKVLEVLLQRSQAKTNPNNAALVHQVIELCCAPHISSSSSAQLYYSESMHAFKLLESIDSGNFDKNTRKSYKAILRALSRTSKAASNEKNVSLAQDAARESIKVVRHMQNKHGKHVARRFHYTELIKAWSHVPTPAGAKRAHAFLREAWPILNHTLPYYLVMSAHARQAHAALWTVNTKTHPANQALQVLNAMEQEWIQLEQEQQKQQQHGNSKEAQHSTIENDDDYDSDDDSDDSESEIIRTAAAPDALCYSAVLNALAKSPVHKRDNKGVYPADVAMALLDRMEDLYEREKIPRRPNLYCYGNVIKAWSKHDGDWNVAAKQAQLVLKRLEQSFPDASPQDLKSAVDGGHVLFWYNIVMRMVAKSSLPDAPQAVQQILFRMESLFQDSVTSGSAIVVAPDSRSYHAAMTAWARNGGTRDITRVHRALEILERQLSMFRHEQSLLTQGVDVSASCKPSVHCYNAVLIACSYVLGDEEKKEALQICQNVFLQLCDSPYATPDAGTFGRMIQCFFRFQQPGMERDNDVSDMFQMCCDYGEVNNFVLGVLRENGSQSLWDNLFGPELAADFSKGKPIFGSLPPEWTRKSKKSTRR